MFWEIIYIIFYLLIFGLIIKHSPFFRSLPGVSFNALFFMFCAKCACGFFFLYIYKFYYDSETADVYKYFHDGMILASSFKENPLDYLRMLSGINAAAEHLDVYYSEMISWYRPWEEPAYNDNRIVIRFNALIALFSGGNISLHNIAANFLSLTGLVAIIKFTYKKIPRLKLPFVYWGILLFPSILFWGSGILKESILFFALGLFLLYSDKVINDKNYNPYLFLGIALSVCLLMLLKSYILLLLIPLLLTYYIIKNKNNIYVIFIYPAAFIIWVSIFLFLGYLFPEYDPVKIISAKQNSFVIFSDHVEAGSIISKRLMNPTLLSLISFIPEGFINTLTRPHLLDGRSILILMAALENLLIWTIIIISVIFHDKNLKTNAFIWFCIYFVIITFVFVGMVTPIYGGLVRYKIPALPFLWIFFISITNTEKIKKYFHIDKIKFLRF